MVWRTTAITLSACFLLGTTFTHWIADHNVLWRSPLTSDALVQSIQYYSILAAAPNALRWVYLAVLLGAIGSVGGRMVKDWRSMHGEVLFDGGSLVLLGAVAYNQVTELLPTLDIFPSPLPDDLEKHPLWPALVTAVRDLANDNVITAVMLTGVMLLQAGRTHAKKPSFPMSPITSTTDQLSSMPKGLSPQRLSPPSVQGRSATPYRELTEDEALELNGSESER